MPSSLGSMKMEAMAKPRKTRAPRKVIFLIEMNLAMRAPAKTAPPVQTAWPRHPPRMTPTTSLMPARTIVASWDLSPHSAMKVRVNVFTNSLNILRHFFPNQEFSLHPLSMALFTQPCSLLLGEEALSLADV